MPEPKVYVPRSSAKQIQFSNGGSMMKLSFKAEDLIAFVQANRNEKGYVNLCVTERREADKYGNTHCIWLDRWKPTQRNEAAPAATEPPQNDNYEPPVPF